MKVVCINDQWIGDVSVDNPVKGEMYAVIKSIENPNVCGFFIEGLFYAIAGFNGIYKADCFRPVDSSFGEHICFSIEKEFELEKCFDLNNVYKAGFMRMMDKLKGK